jgi:hypothetical protein
MMTARTTTAAVAAPRAPGISLRRTLAYAAAILLPWAAVLAAGLYVIAKVL